MQYSIYQIVVIKVIRRREGEIYTFNLMLTACSPIAAADIDKSPTDMPVCYHSA